MSILKRCKLRALRAGRTIKALWLATWELLMTMALNVTFIATIFHRLEDYSMLDSVYWSFVTGWTIGYGDVLPHSAGAKILTIYVIMSMWMLILVISAKVIVVIIPDPNEFTDAEQRKLMAAIAMIRRIAERIIAIVEGLQQSIDKLTQAINHLTEQRFDNEEQAQLKATADEALAIAKSNQEQLRRNEASLARIEKFLLKQPSGS